MPTSETFCLLSPWGNASIVEHRRRKGTIVVTSVPYEMVIAIAVPHPTACRQHRALTDEIPLKTTLDKAGEVIDDSLNQE
ncbi:hypothetical protein GCM10027512_21840 [Chromohalobacter beijerinckii]